MFTGFEGLDTARASFFRFAGHLVAFAEEDLDRYHAVSVRIQVYDARRAARRYSVFGGQSQPGIPGQRLVLEALALGAGGLTAWMTRSPQGEALQAAVDGRTAILDFGPGLDPTSLAISEPLVEWTKDGVLRTARPFPTA
jgi:hypothetical protein